MTCRISPAAKLFSSTVRNETPPVFGKCRYRKRGTATSRDPNRREGDSELAHVDARLQRRQRHDLEVGGVVPTHGFGGDREDDRATVEVAAGQADTVADGDELVWVRGRDGLNHLERDRSHGVGQWRQVNGCAFIRAGEAPVACAVALAGVPTV